MMQARDAKEMNLIHRFVDQQGVGIRVQGSYENPWFCLKDLCASLGITNYKHKTKLLQDHHKLGVTQVDSGQRRNMTFISEPGLYRVIFSCRESNIPGTAPYCFTSWVTETVLPKLRRNGRFALEEEIRTLKSERGRRLWIVVRLLDKFSFNVRRKYFGIVCKATEKLCYLDEFNAPHVTPENLQQVQRIIVETLLEKILSCVPADQSSITDYFEIQK